MISLDHRFVDTHVHFFDRSVDSGLRWSWLGADTEGGVVPDTASIAAIRFTPRELWAEGSRTAGLRKCVHIEAASGADHGLKETEWLAILRQEFGAPHAAIAHVDLLAPDATLQLELQQSHSWVRGVRDLGKNRLLADERYCAQVGGLARRGMLFELLCGRRRFEAAAGLAHRCSETTIVVEHLGLAPAVDDAEAFTEWRNALKHFAHVPNVVMKLSGLGLTGRAWSVADAGRLIEAVLEVFGASRCVVGTNWPMDRTAASYPDVVLATAAALEGLSHHEQDAVLAGNAERLYQLA